jgi:hypothetical protein
MQTEMIVLFAVGIYICYKLIFTDNDPRSAKKLIWR